MNNLTTKPFTEIEQGEEIKASVAMIATLVSFGMLFASLMMGFAMFRFTAPVWPPEGMARPSLLLPTLSTITIFLSSIFYIWFEKTHNRNGLILTIVLGFSFMLIQSMFWHQLKSQGIFVSSGLFASIVYAFTWIHAAHIVAGLGLLIWLLTTGLNEMNAKSQIRIANVGKFWHFLGIVWLIMFVTIFVL